MTDPLNPPVPDADLAYSQLPHRTRVAIDYVTCNPGTSITAVVAAVSPRGYGCHGYAAVKRALEGGFLIRRPDPNAPRWSQLFVPTEVPS